jgi:hypothetical protein
MGTETGGGMTTDHAGSSPHDTIETYEYSRIEERHGTIPKWLLAVYVALAIWMAYYLIQFWSA